MTSYARQERVALADLMESVGPDAPTLCGGWNTYDLAAHLVARERRPDSGPGLLIPAFAGWTEKVRLGLKEKHSYAELIDKVREGAPLWSPWALPMIDAASNTTEYFIHHEDIRRARPGWALRDLPDGLEKALWSRLASTAKFAVRGAPAGLQLATPDGRTVVARSGEPLVTVTGPPSELTMYCSGRQASARVQATGDPSAIAALAGASFGI
jgi:uncharacterized protein (TIGR03085 family)